MFTISEADYEIRNWRINLVVMLMGVLTISKSIRCQGRFAASAAKALRKAHSAAQPYSHLIVWGTHFYYLLKKILYILYTNYHKISTIVLKIVIIKISWLALALRLHIQVGCISG